MSIDHAKLVETVSNDRQRLISENCVFLKDKLMMEFGVHSGGSLRHFRSLYNLFVPNARKKYIYGFDSFEGLPNETKDKYNPYYWSAGQFDLNGNIPSDLTEENGYRIFKGWFEDVLTPEFAESINGEKIGLLHIDCDIYSSSFTALNFCFENDLIVSGTILVYDDWGAYKDVPGLASPYEMGEGLAHYEVLKKYGKTATMKSVKRLAAPPEHHQHYEIATFVVD